MVNVFGDSIASGPGGNLQMVEKVVTSVGRYGGYKDEIQQSYEIGFMPYQLHGNVDGEFLTPIRTYDGHVYVLDDVATMKVTDRYIATYTISNIIFWKGR